MRSRLSKEAPSIFVDGRFFGGSFSASRRVSHAPHGGNRLHGHSYDLAVKLKRKPEAPNKLIFPFEELTANVRRVCEELNNKVLLASGGKNVYKEGSTSIEYVSADNKRYVLPADDVKLLPVDEVTVEALASWIGEQIVTKLKEHRDFGNLTGMEITLYEGRQRGCSVTVALA